MNEEEAKRILMELSTFDYVKLENGDVAIETVLNLLEKKDKQIEYMANFINDNTPYTKDTRILENERGVRNTKYTEKYFKEKVENEN